MRRTASIGQGPARLDAAWYLAARRESVSMATWALSIQHHFAGWTPARAQVAGRVRAEGPEPQSSSSMRAIASRS